VNIFKKALNWLIGTPAVAPTQAAQVQVVDEKKEAPVAVIESTTTVPQAEEPKKKAPRAKKAKVSTEPKERKPRTKKAKPIQPDSAAN
jgi:hypothetical protein